MVVAVMMDVKPQTQRIQMIKPHRQCLRTEMPPSDRTAKDIALNKLNRKDDASGEWIEPQKTRLRKDRIAKTTPPTDQTAKDTPSKGSNHKDDAPNGPNRKRQASQKIEPQRRRPQWTEPQKTVPPQKKPFRR
jgi:hypothetical protein